ncbi:MAG: hypothetical protein LBV74_12060 [Tannerella sp.]|nr:hypothetical protein [Tannerella sp.]
MRKFFYAILPIFLMMSSCSEDEMTRTIFIADKDNPMLPAYTEWGYNSFGAIYDRNYFLVSKTVTPCKITYDKGLLNFYLIGKLEHNGNMVLTFSFPASPMSRYKDLIALNNTTMNLPDDNCTVTIEINGNKNIITPMSGNLTFKRAQLLKIDGEENRVILSGLFELRFLRDGRPEAISNGRFDIGINEDFYSFPD